MLIVEDTPIARKLAQAAMERLGWHTSLASNGSQALAMFQREEFSLVLMDCYMPEMDGFQACTEFRKHEAGKRRTPVIAMTASALPEDRARCFESGMDDCLLKPFRLAELSEMLDRWCPR